LITNRVGKMINFWQDNRIDMINRINYFHAVIFSESKNSVALQLQRQKITKGHKRDGINRRTLFSENYLITTTHVPVDPENPVILSKKNEKNLVFPFIKVHKNLTET